jgi:molybdopterin/thiamine biosynthesis adenylyltransferase
MNDEQLLRYSRHILLPQIGIEGQRRLLASRVLIVGLGGLGSPVAMYLAASGVGHLVLVDDDRVDLSNLQRQIVHKTVAIGRDKVASALDTLQALNPQVELSPINRRLSHDELAEQVRLADAVVDASDNFATRFALNAACVAARKPLIAGAVIRLEGQVMVFRRDRAGGPCYRCLYKEGEELAETCSQTGVLAPVPGVIGTVQAVETIKALLDIGVSLDGYLLLLDAWNLEWRRIKLPRDPACPVCG